MKKHRILLSIASVLTLLSLLILPGCELMESLESGTTVAETATEETATQTTEPADSVDSGWIPEISTEDTEDLPSIADVVAAVRPSVVAINTITEVEYFGRIYSSEGAGSGWIISSDGWIVTNNHVVEGASGITVTLENGEVLDVASEDVYTDSYSDLAMLKVDATGLPAATVGDSDDLRVGDWVVAIGNSLGMGIRATQGIVSQKDVVLDISDDEQLSGLIGTDAAINAGNSGGPLVNMAGEIIGINSVKIAESGVEGTGYAISSAEAMPILQELISKGYVSRPYLGVSSYTVDDYVISRFGLAVDTGVLLTYVEEDSPAGVAGLAIYDVIVEINGESVATGADMIHAIHNAEIGGEIEIRFWRGDEELTTTAVLIEKPR